MRWFLTPSARIVLLVAGVALALVWLRSSAQAPGTSFLARHDAAEWIVYPAPANANVTRPGVKVETEFRRRFDCREVPANAPLRLRAFRNAEVQVNGQPIALKGGKRTWKEVRRADVAAALHAGSNEIVVTVNNNVGPPVLWLVLELPGGPVVSDARWESSRAGGAPRPARDASSPALDSHAAGAVPTPLGGLARSWPLLLLFAALALVAVWGVERLVERGLPARLAGREWDLALWAVSAAWVVLVLHNSPLLHPTYGFDAGGHLAYVERVRTAWSLPLPNEGWQMYQPPLYYTAVAALLGPGGWRADGGTGMLVLRSFQAALALANVALVLALLRALFPGRPRLYVAGVLLTAFLPVQLYLYQYPTNETLTATLALAALCLAVKIVRGASPGVRMHALLGLTLGAALLAKVSALLVAPPILAALAWTVIADRTPGARRTRSIGLLTTAVVALVTCGWRYAHVAARFGHPVVGNWDPATGFARWWQEPGFRTLGDYTRFGDGLVSPLFGAFASLWDGLYSTLWGDGLFGGMADPSIRPPWNDDLLAAGMLLALLPTAAIVAGAFWGIVRLIRGPGAAGLVLGGTSALAAFAVVAFSLKTPAFSQAKVFYALPALGPLCIALAVGVDLAAGAGRWRRRAVMALVVFFAVTSYATYWIDGGAVRGSSAPRGAEEMRAALAVDLRDLDARHALAELLERTGGAVAQPVDLLPAARAADIPARVLAALARVLAGENRNDDAEALLARAIARDPDAAEPYRMRADLRAERDPRAASQDVREALRIDPYDPALHRALSRLLEKLGDADGATRHEKYAARLERAGSAPGR